MFVGPTLVYPRAVAYDVWLDSGVIVHKKRVSELNSIREAKIPLGVPLLDQRYFLGKLR
jgi:hypothetical protein